MLEHGGNLHDAMAQFGRSREDWLDLSTGINPHGYPIPPVADVAWHRLPETSKELVSAALHYYAAPLMLPVAGTQMAIQALPRMRSPSRVVIASPSYAEYAYHWQQHGHSLRQIAYADLDTAVSDCDVMIVCNPNNPTGEMVAPERLLLWGDQLAQRGGWLIVDEAFADSAPHMSIAKWSSQPGLIVLRSLGKFFGLAGLRLGFVAAEPDILRDLANLLGPWTISGPAQQIGSAALCDIHWQTDMRARLHAEGQRLHDLLASYGITAAGSTLFQWWPEPEAQSFWQHMAERGIWVRFFRQHAAGIRLGLPPNENGWQRLTKALEQWKRREINE